MYEVIKTATGPTSVKTALLKSKTDEVITDQSMHLQRWVEHYLELYSTQNIGTDTALNDLPGLPVIEELDNMPTLEELSIAVDGPGHLDLPAEPCFASLPRVTVWLQSREVHSGHDLLPLSAAGEVWTAAAVIVPRLRGPHQSF